MTIEDFMNARIERMAQLLAKRGRVVTLGTCCEARVVGQVDLMQGVIMRTRDLQGEWTMEANQVLVV